MSGGAGIAFQTNYKRGGPPSNFEVSRLHVQQLLDVPNFGSLQESEPGNLAYENGNMVYYDGNAWRVITSGVANIVNAPDTNPLPNPNFILNSNSNFRNLKTQGNGITMQTSSNSIVVNYDPQFTTSPPNPFFRPWVNGRFTAIYSNTISIFQDSNQNYMFEVPVGTSVVNAPNSANIAHAAIKNPSSQIRLLTASDGISITESDPNTNYIKFSGYDQSENFTTTDDTPYSITVPIPLGDMIYYNIKVRGANQTTQKLYYFEFTRGVKNTTGTPTFQIPVANLVDVAGDPVSINFTAGTNEFFISTTGILGQTINWKFLLNKI